MKTQRPPSSPKTGHETIDTRRRAALAQLGLGVATAYAAPTVLKLRSVARANNGRWDSGGWGHGGHHGDGHGPCSNPSRRSRTGGSSGRGHGCKNWRYG